VRTPYTFSILRYVHDPVTQEFINIGVAVYSREAGSCALSARRIMPASPGCSRRSMATGSGS